jgi:hypothetical protein
VTTAPNIDGLAAANGLVGRLEANEERLLKKRLQPQITQCPELRAKA